MKSILNTGVFKSLTALVLILVVAVGVTFGVNQFNKGSIANHEEVSKSTFEISDNSVPVSHIKEKGISYIGESQELPKSICDIGGTGGIGGRGTGTGTGEIVGHSISSNLADTGGRQNEIGGGKGTSTGGDYSVSDIGGRGTSTGTGQFNYLKVNRNEFD